MTYNHALTIAQFHIKEDPLNVDLRSFVHAVKCILKSAETGMGHYLVMKRHIPLIVDFRLKSLDVTGVVETLYRAAEDVFPVIYGPAE